MAENITFNAQVSKTEKYQQLLPQIKALVAPETDVIANLANICAVLKYTMGFFWVGFYRVVEKELVLSVFQGPVACTRFSIEKGVCGACVRQKSILIVPNVDEFDGHIACSSESKSEIVLPILVNNEVIWVLDVDSDVLNDFDEIDAHFLQEILNLMTWKS